MNKRLRIIALIIILGLVLAVASVALGKGVTPAAPGLVLSEPGLSFRYTGQLGETQVPFLADSYHLYQPNGVFVDNTW